VVVGAPERERHEPLHILGPLPRPPRRGRAVQVDHIKFTLKAPVTKRYKLKYDGPLSNFAFKFNLRRYTVLRLVKWRWFDRLGMVGRCRLTPSNPR